MNSLKLIYVFYFNSKKVLRTIRGSTFCLKPLTKFIKIIIFNRRWVHSGGEGGQAPPCPLSVLQTSYGYPTTTELYPMPRLRHTRAQALRCRFWEHSQWYQPSQPSRSLVSRTEVLRPFRLGSSSRGVASVKPTTRKLLVCTLRMTAVDGPTPDA